MRKSKTYTIDLNVRLPDNGLHIYSYSFPVEARGYHDAREVAREKSRDLFPSDEYDVEISVLEEDNTDWGIDWSTPIEIEYLT